MFHHNHSGDLLEELGGSKAILEDINILDLNDFEKYLDELRKRIAETPNG